MIACNVLYTVVWLYGRYNTKYVLQSTSSKISSCNSRKEDLRPV